MTIRAPAAKSRSSRSAQTSRDQGKGFAVMNWKARLFASSSGEKRRQLERALVDPEKNEVVARRRFAAFLSQQILETLARPPDRGEEWHLRRKVRPSRTSPVKNAQIAGQDRAAEGGAEPMHGAHSRKLRRAANAEIKFRLLRRTRLENAVVIRPTPSIFPARRFQKGSVRCTAHLIPLRIDSANEVGTSLTK